MRAFTHLLHRRTETGVLAALHLPDEIEKTEGGERRRQRDDLVKRTAHRPHVRLGVVAHALHHLRSHVERRPHSGLRHVLRELEDAGDAEVAHLDVALLGVTRRDRVDLVEKQVLRFDVAVDDLLCVKVVKDERRLEEPLEHLFGGKRSASLLFDSLMHVACVLSGERMTTSRTVPHHNEDTAVVFAVVVVADDEFVVHHR